MSAFVGVLDSCGGGMVGLSKSLPQVKIPCSATFICALIACSWMEKGWLKMVLRPNEVDGMEFSQEKGF